MTSVATRCGIAIALMAICFLTPGAIRAEEGWEATLKLQLNDEKKCTFERFVFVRQLSGEPLGGLEGRARCQDGREFDFARQKAHQKFELRLCMPTVC